MDLDVAGQTSIRQKSERLLNRISCWQWWVTPLLFGAGLCGAQLLIVGVRFGFRRLLENPGGAGQSHPDLLSGLTLFFLGGALAGLLVGYLLRTASTGWKVFVIAASLGATPVAVFGGLVGGLLGPVGVIAYSVAPYLLVVGLPEWARRRFMSPASRAREGGSCC